MQLRRRAAKPNANVAIIAAGPAGWRRLCEIHLLSCTAIFDSGGGLPPSRCDASAMFVGSTSLATVGLLALIRRIARIKIKILGNAELLIDRGLVFALYRLSMMDAQEFVNELGEVKCGATVF